MDTSYDCIIIGAGPGGLSAAIYLGRAHQKTLVIHSGPRRTGHAVHIQNYFGFENITGKDLLERGMKQAQRYGVEFKLATVRNVSRTEDVFEVLTADGTFFAKRVIVASGISDVMPEIDNIYEFLGETFFTCLGCDGFHLTDKRVCIIGNDEHTARRALFAKKIFNAEVAVCHGKEMDMPEELVGQLHKEGIMLIGKNVTHLSGKDGIVSGVCFEDGTVMECDRVLSSLGYERSDSFLSGMAIKRSETGYIETNENYESSMKGLYVVGPLNTGPDQVSVAVGEGAKAAMNIIDLL